MNAHSPMPMGDVEIPASEVPFLIPADRVACLDLPPPLSVNKTRKIDWASRRKVQKWIANADTHILAHGGMRKLGPKMPGRFEVKITLDDNLVGIDADNAPKLLIDYCKRVGMIVDDSPKYMRRLVVEWGDVPTGCRITLREVG
jgi:hypothetical protein